MGRLQIRAVNRIAGLIACLCAWRQPRVLCPLLGQLIALAGAARTADAPIASAVATSRPTIAVETAFSHFDIEPSLLEVNSKPPHGNYGRERPVTAAYTESSAAASRVPVFA